MDRKYAIEALQRLSIISDRDRGSPVSIQTCKGTTTFRVTCDGNEAEEHISATGSPETDRISVNSRKLIALLASFNSETITLLIDDPGSVLIITEWGETITPERGRFALLMPMRV